MGHSNKSPLKFRRKGSVGVTRDCPNFLGTPTFVGTGKATDFEFCMHIYRVDQNKSPCKILSKYVAVDVVKESRKFSKAPIYRVHHAVIFAIAQLSCFTLLTISSCHIGACSTFCSALHYVHIHLLFMRSLKIYILIFYMLNK